MTNKKVLITAGSTNIPIDQVRVISNIFHGRTGTAIAEFFATNGYEVTLLTSSPRLIKSPDELKIIPFKTFEDLQRELQQAFLQSEFDLVIHSAAVSDYCVSRVLIAEPDGTLVPVDRSKKIASKHKKMYLELSQTPKLIDLMRKEWNFRGFLVKFKLQVGMSEKELLEIAKNSRIHSQADICVANCLEWAREFAHIVDENGAEKVTREQIAQTIERRYNAYIAWNNR